MRILIMAGGTGGHIFPALAVAKKFMQQGHEVRWLGTKKGMESDIIPKHGILIHYINISGLRGKGLLSLLLIPFKLVFALAQAIGVIIAYKPQLVIGMGGYVTGPGGLAARITGKKLVIHEQNAIAGMTNRILANFANIILEAFPHSFPPKFKTILTGNPLREEFCKVEFISKDPKSFNILVIGGSGGAQALNNIMPQVIQFWNDPNRNLQVWHQTGARNLQDTVENYAKHQVTANITDFISDMPQAYMWADIVICRAGALTIAELTAMGKPSILIPFPYAVDDHQTKNAEYLSKQNAGILLPQSQLSVEKLNTILSELSVQKLHAMSEAAKKLAKLDSLDAVISACK